MPFSHLRPQEFGTPRSIDCDGRHALSILAVEHQAELMREASAAHLARLARGSGTPPATFGTAWRYRVGLVMIRFGGWLQGAQDFAPIGAECRDTFA